VVAVSTLVSSSRCFSDWICGFIIVSFYPYKGANRWYIPRFQKLFVAPRL
jgi:hypothetical protein